MTRAQARRALRQQSRFLYLTQGSAPCYQINGEHGVVPRKFAEEITADLFSDDMWTRQDIRLIAQEDGLFPGFSQTWRAV